MNDLSKDLLLGLAEYFENYYIFIHISGIAFFYLGRDNQFDPDWKLYLLDVLWNLV